MAVKRGSREISAGAEVSNDSKQLGYWQANGRDVGRFDKYLERNFSKTC